jgi:hypothetical protein
MAPMVVSFMIMPEAITIYGKADALIIQSKIEKIKFFLKKEKFFKNFIYLLSNFFRFEDLKLRDFCSQIFAFGWTNTNLTVLDLMA